ncbi:family 2B encapsulin nanocompartment shell protein [Catelliglobosispora koreensis]|uniref:family 2B encapsulin nanocompartment shell protein n=1 Tax=Catelliglobosispora koreensis TaxID=129052 RepID=UPI00035F3701|nr:family 2B encapsulin nanocompartment shell protein [Catelliglobosispora koreensis]
MTITQNTEAELEREDAESKSLSLSTAAAKNLATTTKTVPQMQEITNRWLLRVLPWVQVTGGTYRVNRRLSYAVGDGLVSFTNVGAQVRVVAPELCELPQLRGFDDMDALEALAQRFTQTEFAAGETIATAGQEADKLYLLAHGKADKIGISRFGNEAVLGVLADGNFFGERILVEDGQTWDYSVRAATKCIVLTLTRAALLEVAGNAESLGEHLSRVRAHRVPKQNKHGEAEIALASGHAGEVALPGTFVDYELSPREYELSVAQTVLRVHTRVADLYNHPMNQIEQQLRLTVEALRERQEYEMINNREFGLLHNADLKQRIHTRTGPPTPDDMDELLSRRRSTHVLLAHPKAIAAFGRECTKRGVLPPMIDYAGHHVPSWRGVPLLPCSKLLVSEAQTTSIIAMRVGEDDQGVVGLQQTGLPDEYEPGLSVRFMGINEQAIINYLVSAYYSAAVLVPDALGVLENVELGHFHD